MKKIIASSLVSAMILSSITSISASANENVTSENENTYQQENNEIENISQVELNKIKAVVKVNENGHIYLENVSPEMYQKYNLQFLEKHFDSLNQNGDNGQIIINEDLSITDISIKERAVYGEWTEHWWGKDIKFGKINAEQYAADANKAGIILAGGAALTAPFLGVVSGGIGLTSAYYFYLSARVNEENQISNKGVEVKIYWTRNFAVSALY